MRGLAIAALSGLLLTFTPSVSAITDGELEAAKREVEYAKAKADIAEQQLRGSKANVERMQLEKNMTRPGADAAAAPPPADPKAAATKSPADAKKAATK